MTEAQAGAMRRFLSLLRADPYGNIATERTRERLGKLASPRYLASKLRSAIYETVNPEHPWLTARSIALLDRWLTRDHAAFEWGSGRSTTWLAPRVRSLVSVEHHEAWAHQVRAQLEARGVSNVDYRFVAEARYVPTIDEYPDSSFDLILVDGLFRDAALRRSMAKVKPGGRIVFDNANWYLPSTSRTPHSRSIADGPATRLFAECWATLATWPTTWTTNGVNDTVLFERPAS